MDELELLKLLIKENEYPSGLSDEELEVFLQIREANVYLAAKDLCYLKASKEKSITVGPIKIEYPDSDFWYTLADKYSSQAEEMTKETTTTGSGYKYMMQRY